MNALLTSEIRKVTTLKFWWALAIAPIVVGVFASVITSVIANQLGEFEEDLDISGGVASIGLYVAAGAAILFAGIFGAVNAGTEFRHKTITTSFLTARGRDGVIAAKLIVTALFGLGYGLVVLLASLICLLIVWVVFAGHRWPFRLAGLVTGFAVFWGSMILCWNATNGLDSEIFGASVYLFGCQIAWCKMMQLRGTRLVFASDAGTEILGGQRRRQFIVQNVMAWFSAVALLLAVARFASPGWMPWQLCALVAVIGFTQAATAIVIFGLVKRSPAWWIPCVSVPLVAVTAGAVPRLVFDQIKQHHPKIWWHIGLNVAFAALIVVSLSILRWHGYRLAKPAALVRSGQLAPSQDLAV